MDSLGIVNRPAGRTLVHAPWQSFCVTETIFASGAVRNNSFTRSTTKSRSSRIRQAELRILMGAPTTDEAEPFRVRVKIFLRRHQRIKCVGETLISDAATKHLWYRRHPAVHTIARFP